MTESLFRSETMHLYQLLLHNAAAYDCLSKLGDIGCLQFKDLNANVRSFQRKYVVEVRRCDEMERKLRFLYGEIKKEGIEMKLCVHDTSTLDAPHPNEFNDLERLSEKLEDEVRGIRKSAQKLKKTLLQLVEIKHLLIESNNCFEDMELDDTNDSVARSYIQSNSRIDIESSSKFGFITGVIQRKKVNAFERMIWRIARGNVYIRECVIPTPMEDPLTGDEDIKSVFILFYHGDLLHSRLLKVCDGFRVNMYTISANRSVRSELAAKVDVRIVDLQLVLQKTHNHWHRVLQAIAQHIHSWMCKVQKAKSIYHYMNWFDVDNIKGILIGEAWMPAADALRVRNVLRNCGCTAGSVAENTTTDTGQAVMIRLDVGTAVMPPTFNRTNKFTQVFQSLVDAYGINSYRELNPAPYAIISFPFLFSMMYGDVGHAIIISSFAFWMVWNEKRLCAQHSSNEIWKLFFDGRYLILLMGLFSIYTGMLYNDMFGQAISLFRTSWTVPYSTSTVMNQPHLQLDPRTDNAVTRPLYPFGIDPFWELAAENRIVFMNGIKMKMAIIVGVTQMLLGICLSLGNYMLARDYVSALTLFVPQIVFIGVLFVYLAILIVAKWILYSTKFAVRKSEKCAPLILNAFIDMMLYTTKVADDTQQCSPHIYAAEPLVERILVWVALICVPIMWFGKPLWVIWRLRKNGGGERLDIPELWINQSIHTIEYVLGTVSHTASYLRLWALSLAHSQLASVMWTRLLRIGLRSATDGGTVFGVLFFAMIFVVWAVLTVAILVLMEGLSAFLHTLRLHWVEFQSKFYEGKGTKFVPFSFQAIMERQRELFDNE